MSVLQRIVFQRLVMSGSLCLGAFACQSPALEAVRPTQVALDDLMQVNAQVCTQPPADAQFPVKVLFVVDNSDSMSVTDRGGLRGNAVQETLLRYSGNPSVQFSVISFSSKIDQRPVDGSFTNNPPIGDITSLLNQPDFLTDYQGALGSAYTTLSLDMQASSPAERARTKYVVIFFTDGNPDPQCSGSGPDPFLGVCDVPREDWQNAFTRPIPAEFFPLLQSGRDYNQPYQILQSVDDIMSLQDVYHVGEVRVHAGLLYDAAAISDALSQGQNFNLDRPRAVTLLSSIAEHGKGTYTEFDTATHISFLNFNYASVKEPNALADFSLSNQNAIFASSLLSADTDGDGLTDAEEFALKTCVGLGPNCQNPIDSDGDSYSDFFENRFRDAGFDPLDRTKPAQTCRQRNDSDGDGLRDCEELYLGTDTGLVDSDYDRLNDWQELLAHLDPLDTTDATTDADNDGMRNIDEIRVHLNPNERNGADGDTDVRYRYDVAETETRPDGRICYKTVVRNVRLLTTGTGTESPRGFSRLLLSFTEAPTDQPLGFGSQRIACAEVRYVAGAVKSPASGVIELKDENFIDPAAFDPTRDCVKSDAP